MPRKIENACDVIHCNYGRLGLLVFTPEEDPLLCTADVDDNGMINVDDLLDVINAWGPCANPNACPADANDDGTVNVDDLLQVINQWGSSCNGGIAGGGFPESISECFDVYCAGLSGEDWQICINRCVTAVCSQSPPPDGCE